MCGEAEQDKVVCQLAMPIDQLASLGKAEHGLVACVQQAFMYSKLSLSDSCSLHIPQLSDKFLFLGQNGKLLRTIHIRQGMVSVTRLWSAKDCLMLSAGNESSKL